MVQVTLIYQASEGGQAQEVPTYLCDDGRLHLPSVRKVLGICFIKLDGVLVPEDATYSPATYERGARIQVTGSQLSPDLRMRVLRCARFAAHIKMLGSPKAAGHKPHQYKMAAVVVGPRHIATCQHRDRALLQLQSDVVVFVDDATGCQCKEVACTVVDLHPVISAAADGSMHHNSDFILLKVKNESITLEAARMDVMLWPGMPYFLIGQSAQGLQHELSISHGFIATTKLVQSTCSIQGDGPSGLGDLGVFSDETGKECFSC